MTGSEPTRPAQQVESPALLAVVGCSWGGLEAMSRVLTHLPEDAECAIVVAQHRPPVPSVLAELWGRETSWPVVESEDKQVLAARHVYVAPPAYHLLVDGAHLALSTEAPHNHSRPSIDILFESAAKAWANRVAAVVLTGSNADGAAGAAVVDRRGGVVVIQDPDEAVRAEMPRAALAAVPDAVVLPAERIGAYLAELGRRGAAGRAAPDRQERAGRRP
jgi:two-component system chemotaxis response regulator CheB